MGIRAEMEGGSMLAMALALLQPAFGAAAAETTIGKPFEKNGMEVGAVYLQPVVMEPMMPGMMAVTDVHLEADIHAAEGQQERLRPRRLGALSRHHLSPAEDRRRLGDFRRLHADGRE